MDENPNPLQPGSSDSSGAMPGGIPIKFNMPGNVAPSTGIPQPENSQPEATQPVAAETVAPPPPSLLDQLKKYLLPILIGTSILLAIIIYTVITGFLKDEAAITQQVYEAAEETEETTQYFICNENEVLDSENNCICKTNFLKTADSGDQCVYDCETVTRQILDMRLDPTVTSSTEMAEQLARLQTEARENQCEVPEAVKTACDVYMDDSISSMAVKDYIGYYENSKKYIEEDCAKKNLNACDIRLASADLSNRIIGLKPQEDIREEMKKELEIQKYAYYSDPVCNDLEARCAKISEKYGIKNGFRPAASPLAGLLDPGNVFFDDRDYFLTNCMESEPTQEAPVKRVPRIKPQ